MQDQTYQTPPQRGVYQIPPQQAGVYQIPPQQGSQQGVYQIPPQRGVYQTPPQQGSALYQTPNQGDYQTPRQALLQSISTFDKEVLSPWPEYAKSAHPTPTHHVLASGVVPPRDLQRRSPTMRGKYGGGAESDNWNTPHPLTPSRLVSI